MKEEVLVLSEKEFEAFEKLKEDGLVSRNFGVSTVKYRKETQKEELAREREEFFSTEAYK